MGAQSLVDVVHDGGVMGLVHGAVFENAAFHQQLLDVLRAIFGEGNSTLFEINLVIRLHQFGHQRID